MNNKQAELLTMLGERPRSTVELCTELGVGDTTVFHRLKRLRIKMLVRIVEWRRQPDGQRGSYTPVYGLEDPAAPAGDAPRPPPIPRKIVRARWNVRHPEAAKEVKRKTNLKYRAKQRRIRAALWGQLLR